MSDAATGLPLPDSLRLSGQMDVRKVNNSHDMSQSSRIYCVLRVTSLACGRVKIQNQPRQRPVPDTGGRGWSRRALSRENGVRSGEKRRRVTGLCPSQPPGCGVAAHLPSISRP